MNQTVLNEYLEYLGSHSVAFLTDEPMSLHTTFKIGGAASVFVMPATDGELMTSYNKAKELGINVYILGKGSNVLFDDSGFDGAVISTLNLDSIAVNDDRITCGAGYSVTALSRIALENSLSGLTFAYGIPGSVGGAVYMNAGAYNGEITNVLESTLYFDTSDGEVKTLTHDEHKFGYRYSVFKNHPEWIILSATFKLERGDRGTLKAEMDDFMDRRRTKQPLEYPSAGSVFKRYPGRYTAQMIDEAGLKGASVGGAEVSVKHAGFIINKGGATCRDVLDLVNLIKITIKDKFGIEIECEIIHVGGNNND